MFAFAFAFASAPAFSLPVSPPDGDVNQPEAAWLAPAVSQDVVPRRLALAPMLAPGWQTTAPADALPPARGYHLLRRYKKRPRQPSAVVLAVLPLSVAPVAPAEVAPAVALVKAPALATKLATATLTNEAALRPCPRRATWIELPIGQIWSAGGWRRRRGRRWSRTPRRTSPRSGPLPLVYVHSAMLGENAESGGRQRVREWPSHPLGCDRAALRCDPATCRPWAEDVAIFGCTYCSRCSRTIRRCQSRARRPTPPVRDRCLS